MESLNPYIPKDRRKAISRGEDLPDRATGAALFVDVSGFTPLTEALLKELGPRRGADELIRLLNLVYDSLITEADRYGGNVIGFGGDAFTCWFDDDDGLRAVACSLTMQRAMDSFAAVGIPSGGTISLAIKAAVATGPVRRFLVGDPRLQILDVLAGATFDRMAEAERQANKGEVVISSEVTLQLGDKVAIAEWRSGAETGRRFAVVKDLILPGIPLSGNPDRSEEELDVEQIRPWLLPPVYEQLTAGRGHFLAEIRPATALFLKFEGIDYDRDEAAGAKLNTYIQWVQNTLARYESYLIQLTMGDKGSYLYSVFGAPLAHDDDPARAVEAALELRSPPQNMKFILGTRIGISRGRMRAGAYGGLTRRSYGVHGDAVNLAARLMDIAEPGQVLVSQDIVDVTTKGYEFRSIGQVPVKGKQEPIFLSMVRDRRRPSLRGSATPFPQPLVGRDTELVQMAQVLETVLTGEGQILRVEGEIGVGKSHLAAEFAERATRRGLQVAIGACQSIDQNIAYSPWRQIFRILLADFGFRIDDFSSNATRTAFHVLESALQTNPNWLIRMPLLGDLLGLDIPDNSTTATFEPQLRQEALLSLAVEMIQAWAKARSLLVLIDDIQWMDEASLGVTLALGRVIAQAPIMLVLVHRSSTNDDKPPLPNLNQSAHYHHLNLSELPPEGVAALVANRLQGRPSALALSLIQAQAQGNPFFTEELIDTLRESGNLYRRDDGTWTLSKVMFNTLYDANCLIRLPISESGDAVYRDTSYRGAPDGDMWRIAPEAQLSAVDMGIPDSIRSVVLSRLDRLPEAHKVTLKVASAIGSTFTLDMLARTHPARLDQDGLLEQMKILEARDFIRLEAPPPHWSYVFKHNITQEVAYETLLATQQSELHRVVATVLESLKPEAVEQLAYHYSRSAAHDKTVFYLDMAARKAESEYANETALNYYRQLLAFEERWDWRRSQVEILHVLGWRVEEQAALRALEAIPSTFDCEVAYLWGKYHEAVGDYAEAQVAVKRALVACREQVDMIGEMRCLALLGLIARRKGNYDDAKDWYNQASASFQNKATSSDEEAQVLAQTLNDLGIVHRQQGNFDEARRCHEQALIVSREIDNLKDEADAYNSLGITAFYQRNFAGALSYHQQALEIRRAIGDRSRVGGSLISLAQVARDTCDYRQAQAFLAEALTIQQATGNRWEEINVCNDLGGVYLLIGDLSSAQVCLQRGLQLSQDIEDKVGQAYVLSNLGLVAYFRGDLEAAEQLLTEGLSLAEAQADRYAVAYFLSHLGLVSLRAGYPNLAAERANAALALRQVLDLRLWTTADLATLAGAYLASGNREQALAYARQTVALLDECGGEGPEFPHHDYFMCYQVFLAAGDEAIARTALRSAYQLIMRQAEKITDLDVRQSTLEHAPVNSEIMQAYQETFNDS